MTSHHVGLIKQKTIFEYNKKSQILNMAVVSLYWNSNMAALTSRENAPYDEIQIIDKKGRLVP